MIDFTGKKLEINQEVVTIDSLGTSSTQLRMGKVIGFTNTFVILELWKINNSGQKHT
jgi:hypothetical protein